MYNKKIIKWIINGMPGNAYLRMLKELNNMNPPHDFKDKRVVNAINLKLMQPRNKNEVEKFLKMFVANLTPEELLKLKKDHNHWLEVVQLYNNEEIEQANTKIKRYNVKQQEIYLKAEDSKKSSDSDVSNNEINMMMMLNKLKKELTKQKEKSKQEKKQFQSEKNSLNLSIKLLKRQLKDSTDNMHNLEEIKNNLTASIKDQSEEIKRVRTKILSEREYALKVRKERDELKALTKTEERKIKKLQENHEYEIDKQKNVEVGNLEKEANRKNKGSLEVKTESTESGLLQIGLPQSLIDKSFNEKMSLAEIVVLRGRNANITLEHKCHIIDHVKNISEVVALLPLETKVAYVYIPEFNNREKNEIIEILSSFNIKTEIQHTVKEFKEIW